MNHIGWVYFNQGQFNEAFEYDSQALGIYERVKGKESIDYAKALNNIGLLYKRQGKLNQAL